MAVPSQNKIHPKYIYNSNGIDVISVNTKYFKTMPSLISGLAVKGKLGHFLPDIPYRKGICFGLNWKTLKEQGIWSPISPYRAKSDPLI